MSPFLELAIPWLFVFAIVYGALEISNVMKDKKVNAVIAFVVAFLAITSPPVIKFIFSVVPYATIVFVIVFFIGFLTSPLRGKKEGEAPDYTLAMSVIALLFIFFIQMGTDFVTSVFGLSAENLLVGAGLVMIVLVLFLGYKIKG